MSKPPSDEPLAVNRANAARSALNSRKDVFNPASFAVVRLEELDAVSKLRADAIAAYRPVNSRERFAAEPVSLAQPPNLLSGELNGDIQVACVQNRNLCLAVGFQRAVRESEAWKLFVRYLAQTERLYRRAVEEFERLKKLRAELPNEPKNEPINEPIAEPINEPEIDLIAPQDLIPSPPPGEFEDDAVPFAGICRAPGNKPRIDPKTSLGCSPIPALRTAPGRTQPFHL